MWDHPGTSLSTVLAVPCPWFCTQKAPSTSSNRIPGNRSAFSVFPFQQLAFSVGILNKSFPGRVLQTQGNKVTPGREWLKGSPGGIPQEHCCQGLRRTETLRAQGQRWWPPRNRPLRISGIWRSVLWGRCGIAKVQGGWDKVKGQWRGQISYSTWFG